MAISPDEPTAMEQRNRIGNYFYAGWYPYLWITTVAFLLYFKSLSFSYTFFDDNYLVLANQSWLKDLKNIAAAFVTNTYITIDSAFYRPLLTLTFMFNARLGGESPFIYHLTNVALHATACGILFPFLLRLGYRRPTALYLSLLFAVFPAFTQAVAWIPGRNDTLLGVLILAACLSLAHYLEKNRPAYYLLHMLFFLAAMFTKETALAFAVIAPVYVCLFHTKDTIAGRMLPLVTGWLCVIAGWAIMRAWFVPQLNTAQSIEHLTPHFVWNSFLAVILYTGKSVFPFHLELYPHITPMGIAAGITAILFLFAGIRINPERRSRHILFGAIWFIAFLIPTLLVKNNYYFEHRMYVPFMGMLIIFAEAGRCTATAARGNRIIRIVTGISLLLVFSLTAYRRSDVFTGRVVYWQQFASEYPNSTTGHLKLAEAYTTYGLLMPAQIELKEALRLKPSFAEAHSYLGNVLLLSGDPAAAENEYRIALSSRPDDNQAAINIAHIYRAWNQHEKAITALKNALLRQPRNITLYEELAQSYFYAGQHEKARFCVRQYRILSDASTFKAMLQRAPNLAGLGITAD